MDNCETAIGLAEAGLFVFPCCEGREGKAPASGYMWQDWATNKPDEVAQDWDHFGRDCAPALHLAKCGLLVVDLDRKNGKDGVAVFDQLLDEYGVEFPQCPVTATPSNGFHLYFRQPSDREPLGDRKGWFKDTGVDIKGAGYVLAPGSILTRGEIRGTFYEGIPGWPDLCEAFMANAIPYVPDWIIGCIEWKSEPDDTSMGEPSGGVTVQPCTGAWNARRATAYIESALYGETWKLGRTLKGSRNERLRDAVFTVAGYKACPTLANNTVTEQQVWNACWKACTQNGYLQDDGPKAFAATFRKAWREGLAKPLRGPAPDQVSDDFVINLK
jgi:hypothetical protein